MRSVAVLLLVLSVACGGCKIKTGKKPSKCPDGRCPVAVKPETVYTPVPFKEAPVMNLPLASRQKNWTSPGGSGSCVVASSVMVMRWQGMDEMAKRFRNTYSGGQSSSSINAKFEANNLRFAYTTSGDVQFLEWCCRTRRGAGIGYFPSHCICLVDMTPTTCYLLDNNRIGHYIEVPRDEFIRKWHGWGGWGFTLVYSPAPPMAFKHVASAN